jgi:DNA repair protein RecN (Recombination protein N)
MLKELLIKNFAIIDDLNIRFEAGLTILSGETGAGKSIIVNAVNLLLGSRASAKLIRDGEATAELSAFFEVPAASTAAAIMAENGYEPNDGLLVRRVIADNDRHRVYINDRMATMQMLAAITADLASISGQHAHQKLLKAETHIAIIDCFGGLLPLVGQVADLYGQLVPLVNRLDDLEGKHQRQGETLALLQFQAAEIDDAAVVADEDASLEREQLRLKHTESLHTSTLSAIEILHGADGAIVERLAEIRKDLEKAADLDQGLVAVVQALADHLFGLEDVTGMLRSYLGSLDADNGRLDAVGARLDLVNKLKRKYGGSVAALFEKRNAIAKALDAIGSLDDEIERCRAQLVDLHDRLSTLTRRLTAQRHRVATDFADAVAKQLRELKMPGTRFRVDFPPAAAAAQASRWLQVDGQALSASGVDQAVFMIAPNVGESLKPLASIASGGELSRVVLALKAILAQTDAVGTIIFDEVDAGIGGAVADVVGKKLSALAAKHQLICITHLPQIARFGSHHYYIEKQVRKGRTVTVIRPMNPEERVHEIARMLGGEKITGTALAHARSLLGRGK